MSSQGSSTVPYIGARISLISNTNSRYEGILYTIDPKEATVALQNVRCFGTEGREARPEEAVEASPDIYEYIIFRGRDIKDLHVSERPTAPPKPKPLQDPAILSANLRSPAPIQPPRTQGGQFGSQGEFHPMAPGGIADLRSSQGGQSGDENKQAQQGQGQASAAPADGGKGGEGYSGPGTGEFLKRPARHQHQLKPQGGVVPSGEFDFEEANKRFNKDSMVATLQNAVAGKKKEEGDTKQDSKADEDTIAKLKALNIDPSQAPAVGPKYDKKRSFFDEISTDRDARERPESDQLSRVNEETFGDGAANYRSRNFRQFRPRGGAGHRGRGGGGRGRGGGRGGGNNHGGGGEGSSQNREWRNSNRNPDNYGRGRGGRRRDDHGNDRRDDRDNREKRNAPSSYAAAVSASS